MQKQWFPSIGQSLLNLQPGWLATPWWPGDTLRVKQRSLIRILALAHREHLDPQPLIKNLAKGHRGRYRRRLNRLYRRIASGTPILKALEQVPNAISDHDLLALQLGMNTGSLTTTYDRLIQSYGTRADHDSDNRKNTQIYFASLSVIFLLGISFIITFIVPVMAQMNKEFNLADDNLSNTLFTILVDWVGGFLPFGFLIVVIVALLTWIPIPHRLSKAARAKFSLSYSALTQSQILDLFAWTIQSGNSTDTLLESLSQLHFDRRTRRKLELANSKLQSDTDIWSSLADCGLLNRQEAESLNQLEHADTRSWCLREFAEQKRRSSYRNKKIRSRILHPAITLFFALITLIVAAAMLSFLTELVQALATVV